MCSRKDGHTIPHTCRYILQSSLLLNRVLVKWDFRALLCYVTAVCGFQSERGSANMFYTCGPNEAMVVSGKMVVFYLFVCKISE